MKPLILFFILPAVFILFLAGCSGGGPKSSSNVTLKIGVTGTKTAKTVFAGFSSIATTSYIPSVVKKISITISGPGMNDMKETIPVLSGTQSLVRSFSVPNGAGRVIVVVAEDNYGCKSFKGISAPLEMNGTDMSVPIQMEENPAEAIKARLYLYFKDTIEAQGASLAAVHLVPFYLDFVQYGINNGVTRDGMIDKELKDFTANMQGKIMSQLLISILPDTQNQKYHITGKGVFTDGSYGFPDDGFVMVKESGEWKFAGNGYKSEVKLRGGSIKWLSRTANQYPDETGLFVSVRDPGNYGINSAVVIGSGLPSSGLTMQRSLYSTSSELTFNLTNSPQLPGMNNLYSVSDASLAVIPDFSDYIVNVYDVNNELIEQRTINLPTRPPLRSELQSAYFPVVTVPPVSIATDGHYLADARIGSNLSMTVAQPTAFTPSWLQANLSYQGWTPANSLNGFWINKTLLLGSKSATLPSSLLPLISTGAVVSVTAEDFDKRREFTTFWFFNGPKDTMPLDLLITNQIATELIMPTTGAVWKFGTTAPTVVWSNTLFPETEMVDIYLLADNPLNLPTLTASTATFWSKLNTMPIWAVTGRFTLPVVELLGVTGTGCRIIVVAGVSGEWALSGPFTISP